MRQNEEKLQKYIQSFIPLSKNLGLRLSEELTIEIITQVDYYSIYVHREMGRVLVESWVNSGSLGY